MTTPSERIFQTMLERVRAGEPEQEILADYGYVPEAEIASLREIAERSGAVVREHDGALEAVLSKGYRDIVLSYMLDKCRNYHLRRKPENRNCRAYGCQDLSRMISEMGTFGKRSQAGARALLDRLQRAEAMVEAMCLKRNAIIHDNPAFFGEWVAVPKEDFDRLRKARAAWEEGEKP